MCGFNKKNHSPKNEAAFTNPNEINLIKTNPPLREFIAFFIDDFGSLKIKKLLFRKNCKKYLKKAKKP